MPVPQVLLGTCLPCQLTQGGQLCICSFVGFLGRGTAAIRFSVVNTEPDSAVGLVHSQ
jgi:hypothetical protein